MARKKKFELNDNNIAIAYYRFSSHSQNEASIDQQRELAHAWADAHGFKIVKEYEDAAISGTTENRPGFQQMLSEVAKIRPRVLIMWKTDRLGRDKYVLAMAKRTIRDAGCEIRLLAENIPTDGPEGVLIEGLMDAMAEYYSRQLSQNIQRGMDYNAQHALYNGHKLFGYGVDKSTKRYIVDPDTAPFVQRMFAEYAEGKAMQTICDELNAQGLRTTRGAKFGVKTMNKMLQNRAYIGEYRHGDIVVEGGMPALVDEETFDKVQRKFAENKRKGSQRARGMDEFREELRLRGVELNEVRKVDKETGEETVGWSYKAHDPLGKTKRKRRRRASNLADDLTKEGVEAYFEEKQRQAEAQKEDAPAPVPVATVAAEPQPDSPAEPSFDVYSVEESDVAQMAGDLQRAHIDRCRESGEPFMGERYEQLMEAERHPEEQLAKLQAEVDAARREFHASKEARDALNHPCPNLLAGAWVFAKAGRDAKDPVSRMMADMTAMMMRMLLQQAMEEQRRREREAAERRLYESRRNMWDAEKRLKSAEKALAHEDEREEQAKLMRLQEREDRAARRAGGRVKYGADADKQYE